MMSISYAITVHNEHNELDRLLGQLADHITSNCEIVVQCDAGNTTDNVRGVLDKYSEYVRVIEYPLNRNFAEFKNNLKENCECDWIFQIDADEYPDEYLVSMLPVILKSNESVDVLWVPRINTVDGLTTEDIHRWKWNVDKDGRVNFPDYQCRIFRNKKEIRWKNAVHEVIEGHSKYAHLPANEEMCLVHPKTIDRQRRQNSFYATI